MHSVCIFITTSEELGYSADKCCNPCSKWWFQSSVSQDVLCFWPDWMFQECPERLSSSSFSFFGLLSLPPSGSPSHSAPVLPAGEQWQDVSKQTNNPVSKAPRPDCLSCFRHNWRDSLYDCIMTRCRLIPCSDWPTARAVMSHPATEYLSFLSLRRKSRSGCFLVLSCTCEIRVISAQILLYFSWIQLSKIKHFILGVQIRAAQYWKM